MSKATELTTEDLRRQRDEAHVALHYVDDAIRTAGLWGAEPLPKDERITIVRRAVDTLAGQSEEAVN